MIESSLTRERKSRHIPTTNGQYQYQSVRMDSMPWVARHLHFNEKIDVLCEDADHTGRARGHAQKYQQKVGQQASDTWLHGFICRSCNDYPDQPSEELNHYEKGEQQIHY